MIADHFAPVGAADEIARAHAIIEAIPFGLRQGRIVNHLLGRFGKWVRTEELLDAVWFDDPAGGPDGARQSLAMQISHLRRTLAPYGLAIEWHAGGSRRLVFNEGEGVGT